MGKAAWEIATMTQLETPNIREAAKAINKADALLVTAGAGMGVDSGLPDFRGKEGFWRAYPSIAKLGLSFVEMANPSWFEDDPLLAWAFYGHRLNLYRSTIPHDGFAKLLAWGKNKPFGYFVFTSNVDGQFQKAGFDSNRIVECHGSIHHFQCTKTCANSIWDATNENIEVDEAIFRARHPLPKCQHCSHLARPNILMFDDWSWIHERSSTQQKRFEQWLQMLERQCARIAVIEMGAGIAIPSVRITSEAVVGRIRGSLIRINPREFKVPSGHIGLATGALAGIRQLDELTHRG